MCKINESQYGQHPSYRIFALLACNLILAIASTTVLLWWRCVPVLSVANAIRDPASASSSSSSSFAPSSLASSPFFITKLSEIEDAASHCPNSKNCCFCKNRRSHSSPHTSLQCPPAKLHFGPRLTPEWGRLIATVAPIPSFRFKRQRLPTSSPSSSSYLSSPSSPSVSVVLSFPIHPSYVPQSSSSS